jgi:hypothetical protein
MLECWGWIVIRTGMKVAFGATAVVRVVWIVIHYFS